MLENFDFTVVKRAASFGVIFSVLSLIRLYQVVLLKLEHVLFLWSHADQAN